MVTFILERVLVNKEEKIQAAEPSAKPAVNILG